MARNVKVSLSNSLSEVYSHFRDLEYENSQLKMQNLVLTTENETIKYVFQFTVTLHFLT